MTPLRRVLICVGLLCTGVAAQAGLEQYNQCERPDLRAKLATIPMTLGRWVGRDEPVEADIIERAQTDDWINRVYEDPGQPGRHVSVWINYSKTGLNMRHSPEVCLPSGGWAKEESQTKVLEVGASSDPPTNVTRLVYTQGELVRGIGFWYYIFGEGKVERFVRQLPITSRSSHGRTTRGSGLTVEVFYPGESDPEGESLKDFSSALLEALSPLLPDDKVAYHVP
jgi:EpsI family protein